MIRVNARSHRIEGAQHGAITTAATVTLGSKGGSGVEVMVKEPWIDQSGKEGVYAKRVYHFEDWVPGWLKLLLPKNALTLQEEMWYSFPYCKTVMTSPFLGKKLKFTIESFHTKIGACHEDNPMKLDPKTYKARGKVDFIDITEPLEDSRGFEPQIDMCEDCLNSKEIGPLTDGWEKEFGKICAYKLVTVEVKGVWGFQSKIENYLMNFQRQVFLRFHKQVYCSADDWIGMSSKEIDHYEQDLIIKMNKCFEGEHKVEKKPSPKQSPETSPKRQRPKSQANDLNSAKRKTLTGSIKARGVAVKNRAGELTTRAGTSIRTRADSIKNAAGEFKLKAGESFTGLKNRVIKPHEKLEKHEKQEKPRARRKKGKRKGRKPRTKRRPKPQGSTDDEYYSCEESFASEAEFEDFVSKNHVFYANGRGKHKAKNKKHQSQ